MNIKELNKIRASFIFLHLLNLMFYKQFIHIRIHLFEVEHFTIIQYNFKNISALFICEIFYYIQFIPLSKDFIRFKISISLFSLRIPSVLD